MALLAYLGGIFSSIGTWFMGALTTLLPFIASYFGASAVQLLIGVGFGVSTFMGVDLIVSNLMDYALSAFGALPARALQMLGYLWVDKAANLVLSSGVTLMTVKGLKGGAVSRSVWSKPTMGA